ncbi:MAG: hypothetical protein R2698_09030 [Microthrixaceae bacterium]
MSLPLPADLAEALDDLCAGTADVLPRDELGERLRTASDQHRPLRVKLGIDPSGTELTLGRGRPAKAASFPGPWPHRRVDRR